MKLFQAYLCNAWEAAKSLVEKDPSLLDDWKQSCWETLVEAVVLEPGNYLSVYGDGGDCNGSSSRVWKPNAVASHEIYCLASGEDANGEDLALDLLTGELFDPSHFLLDRFVAWNGSVYSEEPPFDHVLLLSKGSTALTAVESVRFCVRHQGPGFQAD